MELPDLMKYVAAADSVLLAACLVALNVLEPSTVAYFRLYEVVGVLAAGLITSGGLYGMSSLT